MTKGIPIYVRRGRTLAVVIGCIAIVAGALFGDDDLAFILLAPAGAAMAIWGYWVVTNRDGFRDGLARWEKARLLGPRSLLRVWPSPTLVGGFEALALGLLIAAPQRGLQ